MERLSRGDRAEDRHLHAACVPFAIIRGHLSAHVGLGRALFSGRLTDLASELRFWRR